MNASSDKDHDQKYGYPASRIIKKLDEDYNRLSNLWNELVKKREGVRAPILNDYFKYYFTNPDL